MTPNPFGRHAARWRRAAPPDQPPPAVVLEAVCDGLLRDASRREEIRFVADLATHVFVEIALVPDAAYDDGWRAHTTVVAYTPTLAVAAEPCFAPSDAVTAVARVRALDALFRGVLESPIVPAGIVRGVAAVVAVAKLPLAVVVALQALAAKGAHCAVWAPAGTTALLALPYGVGDPGRLFPKAHVTLHDRFVAAVPTSALR